MERIRPRANERTADQRLQKAALIVCTELAAQFSQMEPNSNYIHFEIDLSGVLFNSHELDDFEYDRKLHYLIEKQKSCARVEILYLNYTFIDENGVIAIGFTSVTGNEI